MAILVGVKVDIGRDGNAGLRFFAEWAAASCLAQDGDGKKLR